VNQQLKKLLSTLLTNMYMILFGYWTNNWAAVT